MCTLSFRFAQNLFFVYGLWLRIIQKVGCVCVCVRVSVIWAHCLFSFFIGSAVVVVVAAAQMRALLARTGLLSVITRTNPLQICLFLFENKLCVCVCVCHVLLYFLSMFCVLSTLSIVVVVVGCTFYAPSIGFYCLWLLQFELNDNFNKKPKETKTKLKQRSVNLEIYRVLRARRRGVYKKHRTRLKLNL